ncbi:hypothetical protein L208DRAFT_1398283 [Tricholoma matsutake]|nr:hypothetical protein L208DRAFT_1398283 [Tricholoma matsutake 945]
MFTPFLQYLSFPTCWIFFSLLGLGQILERWGGCKDDTYLLLFVMSLGQILDSHPYGLLTYDHTHTLELY